MSGSGFFDPARATAAARGASDNLARFQRARVSEADRPADSGFASLRAAQVVIRRLRLRAALNDAQASIAALLQILDQQLEADRDARSAPVESGVGLPEGDLEGCIGRLAVNGIEGEDVREKQLLQGVHLILQLLDALGVGLRHGLFSSSGVRRNTPPDDGAHRLSGGAK
jgi:hypothetical protein